MRGLPPDFWYYFKEEIRGFNGSLHVSFFAVVAVIVSAMAALISPICFAFLLVLLYILFPIACIRRINGTSQSKGLFSIFPSGLIREKSSRCNRQFQLRKKSSPKTSVAPQVLMILR